ncbi:MAG: hypothetical protein QXE51_03365 [Nitrososphaeria archaeon]
MPCPKRSKKRGRKNNPRRWIQKAIKREGALKNWLKRNEKKVIGAIKESVFDKQDNIKLSSLQKLTKTEFYDKLDAKTKRRINLAINLMKLRK